MHQPLQSYCSYVALERPQTAFRHHIGESVSPHLFVCVGIGETFFVKSASKSMLPNLAEARDIAWLPM